MRIVDAHGTITTLAGTGVAGFSGDGGPAARARLRQPTAVSVAADGGILVADRGNLRIRRIAPPPDRTIATIAGGGLGTTPAQRSRLDFPTGVAAAPDGSFLIAESAAIRRVAPDGTIMSLAGTGYVGYNGNVGAATSVKLHYPTAVAAMPDGGALIADTVNDRVRVLDQGRSRIKTVAGIGVPGPPGTPEPPPPEAPPDPPLPGSPYIPSASEGARPSRSAHCVNNPGQVVFTDLLILPYDGLTTTGQPVRVKMILHHKAKLIFRILTRQGKAALRKPFAQVKGHSGAFHITLARHLKPGVYRIEVQGISIPEKLRRCDTALLKVRGR